MAALTTAKVGCACAGYWPPEGADVLHGADDVTAACGDVTRFILTGAWIGAALAGPVTLPELRVVIVGMLGSVVATLC